MVPILPVLGGGTQESKRQALLYWYFFALSCPPLYRRHRKLSSFSSNNSSSFLFCSIFLNCDSIMTFTLICLRISRIARSPLQHSALLPHGALPLPSISLCLFYKTENVNHGQRGRLDSVFLVAMTNCKNKIWYF